MVVEYRVRPVTRYIVTRYEQSPCGSTGGSSTSGEFERFDTAHAVATALCDHERVKAGAPLDSPDFLYPDAVPPEGLGMPDRRYVSGQIAQQVSGAAMTNNAAWPRADG